MTILNLVQGSPEWLAARDKFFCASDAPSMLGLCQHKTRAELLKEKALGITATISPAEQAIFDRGHAAEAAIRPHIASLIGDELFPVVLQEGSLLASLDGITMDDETIFEHKIWNDELAAQVKAGELTPHYFWQLEHQLHVSKAKRVIFVCSDGTPEKCVHMFYTPFQGRAEFLLTAWNQFDADLCAYTAPAPDPIVEKKALMALPSLSVQLVGKVTASNLPAYRDSALEFIKAINTDLQTDQDFADAEQTVKFCETAEKNIQVVKDQAIAQTASIDELFRSLDQIADAMRQKRLMLNKLVTSRKEQIRAGILQAGRNDWNAHVNELNRGLRRVNVTVPAPDFAAAMKGKRTLASLREAVDSVLTSAKVTATQQSELFASRLAIIDEVAKEHEFLVRDLSSLVAMPTETLSAVIKQRISDHKAVLAKRQADVTAVISEPKKEDLQKIADPAPKPSAISSAEALSVPTDSTLATTFGTSYSNAITKPLPPGPDEIIDALVDVFGESEKTVLGWLRGIDWTREELEAAA
jgi:putative phage-type endonuclease